MKVTIEFPDSYDKVITFTLIGRSKTYDLNVFTHTAPLFDGGVFKVVPSGATDKVVCVQSKE